MQEENINELRRFQEIVESVEDMIYELDNNGVFSYANKAMEKFSGFSRTELKSISAWELVREDFREEHHDFYSHQIKTLTPLSYYEFPVLNKEGKEIWIGQNIKLIIKDNWVIGARAIARDITRRKEAEARLAESQEIFRKAQEVAKIGSWEYNVAKDQLIGSEETFRIHGLPPGEAVSLEADLQFYAEESREVLRGAVADCISKGTAFDLKLRFFSASKTEKWVRIIGAPTYKSGQVVKIAGVLQDISTDKLNELKLENYQNSLELLNRIASDQNVSSDQKIQNALTVVSEYLQLPLGSLGKIEDNTIIIQHHVIKDNKFNLINSQAFPLSKVCCDITFQNKDVVAISHMGASEYASHESYTLHKMETYLGIPVIVNNATYGVVSFASPEIREKGFSKNDIEFIRLLARWIGSSIERKEAKEKLLLAKEKAEAASHAKGEFLSVMSHEIRTPLNAVIGMAHLLLQKNPQPHQLKYLKTLRFSSENLLVMVNDILDYSKIEASKIIFEEVDFNLKDLIFGIKESLSIKAEEKNVRLKVMMDWDLPEVVKGDSARLAQILNNLVGNALKFTEKGFVKITASLLEEEEEYSLIEFAVEDTGIGITKEKQSHIFDKFSQAESDTTRRFGGTGLGLSISKRLLELQGSEIQLESEVGKGSRFFFSLKLARSSKTTQDLEPIHSTAEWDELLKGTKILLAEDNEVNQFLALEFLQAWGLEVDTAVNGLEAVNLSKTNQYELILMDLQMPVMDGYSATKAIKAIAGNYYRDIPILALTASALLDSKDKVYSCGMVDFIAKPFNPNELRAKLEKHLKVKVN